MHMIVALALTVFIFHGQKLDATRDLLRYKALVVKRFVAGVAAAVLAAALTFGVAAPQSSPGTAARWKLHDLGRLRGLEMAPVAVNERGDIVGYGYGAGVAGRAFLFRGGKLVDLGRCGGYSTAVAINARGDAVGSCGRRKNGKPDHAFLWRNGKAIDLGTGGWTTSEAVAINSHGEIAGNRFLGNQAHAFLWRAGKMRDLGTLGGSKSEATAIDDNGDVVGESTTASGEQHGFLWRDGKMTDLGTLGGSASAGFNGVANEQVEPRDVNGYGTIVGLVHDPVGSYETAFLWRNGKLSTFGSFDGQPNRAVALNDRGQVLLQTTPPTDKRGDAYVWTNGKLAKLPAFDPAQPATFASGLDDRGDVAGRSLVAIGHMRPFVWWNGRMYPLPTLDGKTSAPFTSVSALNSRGIVVGASALHLVTWTR